MDDVEAHRAVVVAVVVDLEHVADEVADAVAHPRLGDDLLPHLGAARQVDDRRPQPLVAAAERHRVLAVGAGHVEHRVRAFGERDRLRDFGAGEPRQLVLAADVGAPVGVLGRLSRAARRGCRRGPGPPAARTSPSIRRCRRGSRRGRCPSAGRARAARSWSSRSGRPGSAGRARGWRSRRGRGPVPAFCRPRCSASSPGSRGPSASAASIPVRCATCRQRATGIANIASPIGVGSLSRSRPRRSTAPSGTAAIRIGGTLSAIIARMGETPTSRLLLACPDRPGLIAAVSGFLADAGLNIVDADQHSSDEGRFFMRMVFDRRPGRRARGAAAALRAGDRPSRFEMDHRFAESSRAQAGGDHGLARGPLPLRPALALAQRRARRPRSSRVISNHPDHADQVDVARPPLPPRAGRRRRPRPRPSAQILELLGERRPARPRPLHADPLRRLPRAARTRRRSTSTTASCPPSSAPTPTTAPTSAASS